MRWFKGALAEADDREEKRGMTVRRCQGFNNIDGIDEGQVGKGLSAMVVGGEVIGGY